MPDYSQNPGDDDLQAFLTAACVWKPALAAMLPGYAAAAVERFEEATGRTPYLAAGAATVLFDAPTPEAQYPRTPNGGVRMDLDVPFVAITGVAVDRSPDAPLGTPLEIDRDVFLYPERREIRRRPIEWLEFARGAGCGRKSVRIDGTPGSAAAWPADLWNAVLAGAAASFVADVVSAATGGGLASWKEADVSEVYGELKGPFGANLEMWRATFDRAVLRNVLVGAG